jgi:hypothetical protein
MSPPGSRIFRQEVLKRSALKGKHKIRICISRLVWSFIQGAVNRAYTKLTCDGQRISSKRIAREFSCEFDHARQRIIVMTHKNEGTRRRIKHKGLRPMYRKVASCFQMSV